MLLSALLAASLWQASTQVGLTLSCYSEKERILCYDQAGKLAVTAYYTPAESYLDPLAWDLAANLFGTAADLGSTDWGISRGCREGNSLGPRPESRAALKLATNTIRGLGSYFLRRKKMHKAANIVRYAGLALDLGFTTNNIVCGINAKGN